MDIIHWIITKKVFKLCLKSLLPKFTWLKRIIYLIYLMCIIYTVYSNYQIIVYDSTNFNFFDIKNNKRIFQTVNYNSVNLIIKR